MFNPFKYSYTFRIINRDEEFNSSKIVEEKTVTLEDGTKIHVATVKRNKPIPPAKYTKGFAKLSFKKLFGPYMLKIVRRNR